MINKQSDEPQKLLEFMEGTVNEQYPVLELEDNENINNINDQIQSLLLLRFDQMIQQIEE